MTKAKEITGENFEEDVLNSETFVLVDFWAPWCQPCLMMAPTLDELSEELEGKVKIVKVDVENQENQELAMKYQIQSIPNMKLFKGGEFVKEIVGLKSKEALKSELDEIIN
jgi:thioredoxin 1